MKQDRLNFVDENIVKHVVYDYLLTLLMRLNVDVVSDYLGVLNQFIQFRYTVLWTKL